MSSGEQDRQQEMIEDQRAANRTDQAVQRSAHEPPQNPGDLLNHFVESDIKFSDQKLKLLEDFLTRDYPMGNYDSKGENYLVEEVRLLEQMILDLQREPGHPMEQHQAAMWWKMPDLRLDTYSGHQEVQIQQLFSTVRARIPRGRDMKQQEQPLKSINIGVHRDESDEQETDGSFWKFW